MTTTSSVRMKLGPVEFECTASEEFLKDELPALIAGMAQLYKEHFANLDPATLNADPSQDGGTNKQTGMLSHPSVGMTSICLRILKRWTSCTDLVLAAALRLVRAGQPTFTRAQIVERMRQATGYFKKSYASGNSSKSIQVLITSGKLLEQGTDTYALSDATRTELEARLAQP